MGVWKEWCPQLWDRRGTMVPIEKFDAIIKYIKDPGYSSVYGFDDEAANEIMASGMSRNFGKYSTISNTLSIDLDDAGESLPETLIKLQQFKFELFFSGGKGHHIILHHDSINSKDLPYSHRKWVEDMEIKCDMSLYQAGRILSLPGRIHKKTGKRKELLKVNEGDNIDLKLVPKPEVMFNFSEISESSVKDALAGLWNLSLYEPLEGSRHMTIWKNATELFKAGFQRDAVESFILHISKDWKNSLTEGELTEAIRQAYRRIHG
jgi:hypothetical protein